MWCLLAYCCGVYPTWNWIDCSSVKYAWFDNSIFNLSNRIGLAISAVSSYESGSRYPSYEALIKLARIFHVSTDYLLGMTDKRNVDVTGLDDESGELVSQLVDKLRK